MITRMFRAAAAAATAKNVVLCRRRRCWIAKSQTPSQSSTGDRGSRQPASVYVQGVAAALELGFVYFILRFQSELDKLVCKSTTLLPPHLVRVDRGFSLLIW